MTNREIYQKTLSFSLRRALFDILAFLVLGALTFGGFLLMEKLSGEGLVGLVIGLLLGIVVVAVALRNYMESGMSEVPTEASFALLDEKSPRFRKLRAQGV